MRTTLELGTKEGRLMTEEVLKGSSMLIIGYYKIIKIARTL